MTGTLTRLVCCLFLLALIGTVSGAGYAVSEKSGDIAPVRLAAGPSHAGTGLPGIPAESGRISHDQKDCYFPITSLPAFYVCIMFCKIGGGGDSCAPACESALLVCP